MSIYVNPTDAGNYIFWISDERYGSVPNDPIKPEEVPPDTELDRIKVKEEEARYYSSSYYTITKRQREALEEVGITTFGELVSAFLEDFEATYSIIHSAERRCSSQKAKCRTIINYFRDKMPEYGPNVSIPVYLEFDKPINHIELDKNVFDRDDIKSLTKETKTAIREYILKMAKESSNTIVADALRSLYEEQKTSAERQLQELESKLQEL